MAKSIYTNSEVDETNPFYYAATNQVSPDNPFYSYARSPEQTAEDDYATEVKAVVDSVDNNTWDWNDTLLTARSFVDGLYLNKAEEIGSWVSAATFKLLYPELAGDQPVSEIRKEMLLDLEAESARFIEERPVAAMTSNIAGAVLSPVSIATGKGLAQAANLRRGSQQLASQASAQTVLKGAGAADEAALASQQLAQQYSGLSPRIYDVVTRTPTPVLASGAAAVEGGIIGYEGEDKLQSAVTTGAVSAVVPFAFEGAKYALNAPIKERIAQQLGEGRDFVNLMFTDHPLRGAYQHLVGKAFGGRSLTEQQVRGFASRIASSASLNEKKINLAAKAKEDLDRSARVLKGDERTAKEAAESLKTTRELELTGNNLVLRDELDDLSRSRIDALEEVTNKSKEELEYVAVKEADAAVNAAQAGFRSTALAAALPKEVPKDVINDILSLSPQDALKALDTYWKNYGFKSAKSRSFQISVPKVGEKIKSLLENNEEAYFALKQSNSLNTAVEFTNRVLSNSVSKGRISGEDLINLRSRIGTLLNDISEDKTVVRNYVSDIQQYFDDIIESQLKNPKAKEAFLADRQTWATKKTVEDAVARATGANKNVQGAFSPDDWIAATKQNSKYFAARGLSPLQREAQEVSLISRERDRQIKELAEKNAKRIVKEGRRSINAEKTNLARRKKAINLEQTAELKRINEDYAKSAKTATDRRLLEQRKAQAKSNYSSQLEDIDAQINQAAFNEKWLLSNMTRDNVSTFESLFATGIIGQASTAAIPLGVKETLLTGIVGAKVLSTEGAQRALAGQTGVQQTLRDLAQEGSTISRSLGERGFAVAPTGAAAVGEGDRQKVLFSDEVKGTIQNMDNRTKAKVYQGLINRGQTEILEAQDPKFYEELKKAYINKR
jgi:hypothetical protein